METPLVIGPLSTWGLEIRAGREWGQLKGDQMELTEGKLTALEGLVNELMKPSPEEDKIQVFLKAAGLNDPKDPLARIHAVLDALRFEHPDKEMK